MQLLARMKLQRVVFGAFALVLVCLFALGLSAYRRMQAETRDAHQAEQNAEQMAKQLRARVDALERELQATGARLDEAEFARALLNCRLAMHEIRDGNTARARTLLDEAKALGAPAWWPLVAQLTQDTAVRFEGGELTDKPIIAGAISGDLAVIAVARQVTGGVVVETWGALDGKLKSVSEVLTPSDTGAAEPARLLLNGDGTRWFLALPLVRFFGLNGTVTRQQFSALDFSPSEPDADTVLNIASNPDLTLVYESKGAAGLAEWSIDSRGQLSWRSISSDLGATEVQAVCLAGDQPVFATPRGIYRLGQDGRAGQLHLLEQRPDRIALHHGAGVVYAAILFGRSLNLLAIRLGDAAAPVSSIHEMPDEPVEDLRFLADDTPVWTGRSGRIITLNFGNRRDWTLGGYTLSFVERHPRGLVFGNRKGELSVRVQDEFTLGGVPRRMVPPQFVPEALAHGFSLQSPQAERFVLQHGRLRALGAVLSVTLAPQGPAYDDGGLVLPDGTRSPEEGALLGAFADGRVLLFAHKQKLKLVGVNSLTEFMLPGERAPDALTMSAQAVVAALRVRDTVYVADMRGDPLAVASRLEVAPDLLALDAAGTALAVAYGPLVVIHSLRGGPEQTVRTSVAPRRLALLFRGTVLVALEAAELVFYEVATGRELVRGGTSVTDLAASGDASLNVVAGGWLRTVNLQPPP